MCGDDEAGAEPAGRAAARDRLEVDRELAQHDVGEVP